MKSSCRLCLISLGLLSICSSAAQVSARRDVEFQPESQPGRKIAAYQRWLDEDELYLANAEERREFLRLSTDADRDRFIEEFWKRRDPTPDTAENEFKEEDYRRLAYSNEHFAAAMPGFKSDRGHIYIVYGPPDEIVSDSQKKAGHSMLTWYYRGSRTNSGRDLNFKFVDECECNDYRLQTSDGDSQPQLNYP